MQKDYDVVIVGSGVAGLYGALNLDKNLKVLLVCKRELQLSNSSLAQGGIASVLDKQNDSIEAHIKDTLIAGGYKNNPQTTEILANQGPKELLKLIDYGVCFDKNPDGSLHATLEGGHSKPRIYHHKDSTGKEVVDKLLASVLKLENVEFAENAVVCGIKHNENFSFDILSDGRHQYVNSHFCLLATGGIGRVYEYTTNSKNATGDGIALAYELGAKISQLSYIQFHPTAFANEKTRESFLISESVRGEGAHLLNFSGERFMQKYDERLELAPRDVVSRSIIMEEKATGSNRFYIDISHKDSEFIINRFPMIYKNLLGQGFDMTKQKIPVYPCQHYLMGGINVDADAKTSIKNLYAAGECANTGVHGNNRLASNSLLEGLVFSHRAAKSINRLAKEYKNKPLCSAQFPEDNNKNILPHGIRTKARSIIQNSYFVIPDKAAIKEGFESVCELMKLLKEGDYKVDLDFVEARSIVTIVYLILKEVL